MVPLLLEVAVVVAQFAGHFRILAPLAHHERIPVVLAQLETDRRMIRKKIRK